MNTNENPRLYASLPCVEGAARRAVIDLAALRHNYRVLCERADGALCICVVKADAYGHGAQNVVRALHAEGCRFFAVSCLEEALAIRAAAPDADILIFGQVSGENALLLAKHRLTATGYSAEAARELSDAATRLGITVKLHIKLDTGMNRVGFPAYDGETQRATVSAIEEIFSMKSLAVTGIYSHFATADESDKSATHRQAERFLAVTDALEKKGLSLGIKHLCNSAGAMRFADEYRMNAVRLGIALYGYRPDTTEDIGLLPVMRLESEIVHIHTLPAHERVGYGGTFEANEPRLIATLSIGYADGWLRAYTGARVTVHTKAGNFSAAVVGRICMDQCMLDVTGLPVKCGDKVTLFGLTGGELEALAVKADTIPYECLCLISARVPRVTKEEPQPF